MKKPDKITAWLDRLPLPEKFKPFLVPAFLLGIFVFLISSFEEVVDDALEGDTHEIDTKIITMLRNPNDLSDPIGPFWLQEMIRDFTALGGIGVLTFITLATVIYLFVIKKYMRGVFLLAAISTGTMLSNFLKAEFERPRPDFVPHYETYVSSASLPSGHSMMAALVYLTLGALLAEIQPTKRLRIFFIVVPALLVIMVGFSRIYLGVHWPSDVVAGWIMGCAWALLFWMIERYLFTRRKSA
jgi:undecaprenyl-diphosphatase